MTSDFLFMNVFDGDNKTVLLEILCVLNPPPPPYQTKVHPHHTKPNPTIPNQPPLSAFHGLSFWLKFNQAEKVLPASAR